MRAVFHAALEPRAVAAAFSIIMASLLVDCLPSIEDCPFTSTELTRSQHEIALVRRETSREERAQMQISHKV